MNPCFPFITHREEDPTGQPSGASNFIVRTAHQRDLSSLAEILADSFHPQSGIMALAYPFLKLGIYEDLRIRLRSLTPNNICLVAIASNSTPESQSDYLAGTVEIALRSPYWQYPRSQYPYISNLAVRSSCRRRGVAGQLLAACERTTLDWGFQDIYLHVLENNHQARQLYLKAGYRLHQVDSKWSSCLRLRPRRLFLHKHLAPTEQLAT